MAQGDTCMLGDIRDFASEMKKMVNNKDMSDIRFLIGPNRKSIYAHRCILSARCEVFKAMFSEQQSQLSTKKSEQEVPFVLSDITLDVFLPLLEFIYTNCVTLNGKIAIDVLGTAIEYGQDGLRQLCVQYLQDNLAVNNVCDAMQAAVTYGQDDLRTSSLKYIEQNTQNVFRSKSFHELSPEALAAVLCSDDLTIDEVDVISSVREWATVNSVVLGKSAGEVARKVVPHIRLPLLSPDELKKVEEENQKDRLIPVELISYAWRFHALKKGEEGNKLTTKRKGTANR